jgi:hypothetical protein
LLEIGGIDYGRWLFVRQVPFHIADHPDYLPRLLFVHVAVSQAQALTDGILVR